MSTGRILVVDVGTSSVRSGIVTSEACVTDVVQIPVLPTSPEPGQVEFDALAIKASVLETARAALATGPVDGIGIANQRATTVVWDARTGLPIGPAIGWQDLRTVINCLLLQAEGLRLAPNVSATKAQWLLDTFDPSRTAGEHLRFGTMDTWITWILSDGSLHVTDATNAAVTGLVDASARQWDARTLEVLGIPATMMPTIVDSSGSLGAATALEGAPLICGIAGDQQASLIGQGCVAPGQAKITFGTGGMLDLVEAAETDSGIALETLRVDGGMTENDVFLEILANTMGRPIEVSPVREATTLGAGYLAGLSTGLWTDEADVAASWAPRRVVEPTTDEITRAQARERFLDARSRSERTIPDLSGVEF